MKTILIAISLLTSSMVYSAEAAKGLGQFDAAQCGCETCFTKYGHCTAVKQDLGVKDTGRRTVSGKRRTKTTNE